MKLILFAILSLAILSCSDEKCDRCPDPKPSPETEPPKPQPAPQPNPGSPLPIPLPPDIPFPIPGGPGLPIPGNPGQPGSGEPSPGSDQQLLDLELEINKARRDAGLSIVASDKALACAAAAHAKDIGPRQACSHTGSDGSSFTLRVTRCGGTMGYGGEIIACGQGTPKEAVQAWLNSPGHRAIMLDAKQRSVGVGMVGNYWVAVFSGG